MRPATEGKNPICSITTVNSRPPTSPASAPRPTARAPWVPTPSSSWRLMASEKRPRTSASSYWQSMATAVPNSR